MSTDQLAAPRHQHPLKQEWPAALAQRYREAGYWRGETMTGFLRHNAAQFAHQTAIAGLINGQWTRWTYAQFWEKVETAAAGFLALGLQAGDRVVVQIGNVPQFYSAVFGLFRAGLIPVYALPAHRLTEIQHFATKAEASAYIVLQHYEQFDYRTLAREALVHCPTLQHAIVIGEDCQEFCAFNDFEPNASLLPTNDADPQAVAFLQISGGSTGLSKLIPRTHDDYIYSFRASNEICNITANSVYMVALPAAHNFPMSSPGAFGALYAGATVVLSPTPSPETAFPLIAQEKVTAVGLVPPLALLWSQAAQTTTHDLSSLQVVQVGGAKLTPEAAKRVLAGLKCQLQQVFGMAEGLVNYTRLNDSEEVIVGTQGRPISPADEVLVVDDHGHPLDSGQTGYLLTRGPYTLRAYHNDDAANARSFTEDGFYRTGDVVLRTPEGYLIVQGRATDHINRAGEKISAEEIEDHLLAHPQVFDATVVSIPDEFLGERSCAFIIAKPNQRPRAIELKQWFKTRDVAAFKIPDQIVFVDSFGTTAVGKTSRKELRAQLRQRLLAQEK
ncbi:2,3-dihydroxybenzoate-AMP ligase [Lampropedia puyangensis]|uniref:2,3-dihydroxybenzoate-AMP ligase n=1 Tax=Lampropedia puyangensis TaxID=1330072 RepID=A0A4S8EU98_9BURK|nr:AMP-binding protein [Lampropedia puyangensis]THT97840.1 2,3-dihydroxybenzoate-AMP ligase [Lampropedia puyangensis]